jgi:hypothetical protein
MTMLVLVLMVYDRKNEPGNEPTKGYLGLSKPDQMTGHHCTSSRLLLDSIRLCVCVTNDSAIRECAAEYSCAFGSSPQ